MSDKALTETKFRDIMGRHLLADDNGNNTDPAHLDRAVLGSEVTRLGARLEEIRILAAHWFRTEGPQTDPGGGDPFGGTPAGELAGEVLELACGGAA